MSELKATPGPWFLEYNAAKKCTQVAAFEASGNRSMQVLVESFNPEDDKHLIAAAPELYEALNEMLERYAPAYHDCVDNGLPECEICNARAALAKARGERT